MMRYKKIKAESTDSASIFNVYLLLKYKYLLRCFEAASERFVVRDDLFRLMTAILFSHIKKQLNKAFIIRNKYAVIYHFVYFF